MDGLDNIVSTWEQCWEPFVVLEIECEASSLAPALYH